MAAEDGDVAAVARVGDGSAFAAIVERHRVELLVHCYRMLGSFDEAEDTVQEVFLRAWRGARAFRGESTPRTWLYRIATNTCLDVLRGRTRRMLPDQLGAASGPDVGLPPREDIPWLQPFPDRLAERAAPSEAEPDAVVLTRETIELAFLAAIQYLPPRQRAVLILRDVLGWRARQVADLLDASVAAVNSALQRARATLREQLPHRHQDWSPPAAPTEHERAVLRRYMAAMERADLAAMAELLAEDVRATMPPYPMWHHGRDTVMAALSASWEPSLPHYVGRFRTLEIAANRQPAVAAYVRRPGEPAFRAFGIGLLRISGDHVTGIDSFHDVGLFRAFGLPASLPPADR